MPKRVGVYRHEPTNTWYFKKRVTASDGTKRQVTRRGFLTAADADPVGWLTVSAAP